MYVCMYVCMYIYIYIHVHIRLPSHIPAAQTSPEYVDSVSRGAIDKRSKPRYKTTNTYGIDDSHCRPPVKYSWTRLWRVRAW